jgi:hypothetical protein
MKKAVVKALKNLTAMKNVFTGFIFAQTKTMNLLQCLVS